MTATDFIVPPPELRRLWAQQAQRMDPHDPVAWMQHVSDQAAQWGSDQELEACCEEMKSLPSPFGVPFGEMASNALRAARRPNPPTLKEQALKALHVSVELDEFPEQYDTIRRALETLDD